MQQPMTSLLGYNAGGDGCSLAHLAEVILCEIYGMAPLSHSVPMV